VEMLEMTSMAG